MEVIYFTRENLQSMNLVTVENLASNTILSHVAESLKNEKKDNKIQECQRLITEMYVQLMLIKDKATEIKQKQIRHRLKVNKWMSQMRKVDRIVKEANIGSFEYL
jgi:hypothetical protein